MNLTPAERDRFAAWLAEEARTEGILIEQMKKLLPPEHPLVKLREADKMAAEAVLQKLLAPRESVTLASPEKENAAMEREQISVGIIGTAGRDKSRRKVMDLAFYRAMYRDARRRVRAVYEEYEAQSVRLVSGGAAWSDHLAVSLFLKQEAEQLQLHLPAVFANGRFVGREFRSPGRTSNYYHQMFTEAVGHDTLGDIAEALEAGAEALVTPGFHARNQKVAADAEILIAYTWGAGDEPSDGGTRHTWNCSPLAGEQKIHVPLGTILESLA